MFNFKILDLSNSFTCGEMEVNGILYAYVFFAGGGYAATTVTPLASGGHRQALQCQDSNSKVIEGE